MNDEKSSGIKQNTQFFKLSNPKLTLYVPFGDVFYGMAYLGPNNQLYVCNIIPFYVFN